MNTLKNAWGCFFSDEHLNATILHDYAAQNQTTNSDQQLQTTDESTQTEITVEEIQELMAENLTIKDKLKDKKKLSRQNFVELILLSKENYVLHRLPY